MKERKLRNIVIAVSAVALACFVVASAVGEDANAEGPKSYHRNVKKMGESINHGLGAAGKGLGVRSKSMAKNVSPYSDRSFSSRGAGDSESLRAAHDNAFAAQYAAVETKPAGSAPAATNETAAIGEPVKSDTAPPPAAN